MLLTGAAVLAFAAFAAWVVAPPAGLALLFIAKPIVDATFSKTVAFGLHLTEIVGVLVPLAALGHLLFAPPERALRRMPLWPLWAAYAVVVFWSSLLIAYNEGLVTSANVFFRQINGCVGFYLVQAWFHPDQGRRLRPLLLALLVAGLFPIGIGAYQFITGAVWTAAQAEGLTRYVGLYHDAFTVRAYAFQTLFALLLFTALYSRERLLARLGALAYGAVALVVLFRAYSKAGLVSLVLWAVSWVALQRKYTAMALLGLCGAGGAALYADVVVVQVERLFHKEIGVIDGDEKLVRSFAGRWYGWREMIERWQGFSWPRRFVGSGEVGLGAHNDYLQILFHGGIVGVAVYVTLLAAIGWRIVQALWRRVEPIAVGALMLYLMWLVDTIGLVPSAYPGYQWFVWGFIGLALRLRQEATGELVEPAAVAAALRARDWRVPPRPAAWRGRVVHD